mmetsp:Transcript_56690/g.106857  ORF Transcript_56690/g.106857 Transcript_56690/m.106857 type:complete len:84 (+) Transcript_56690:213-464(+)
MLSHLVHRSWRVETPQKPVFTPVIKSRLSASCAITQQLHKQEHNILMITLRCSPPSFSLRSVNEFATHNTRQGQQLIPKRLHQ